MNSQLPTLIRRELWEHRVLWIAPVVVAVLMLVVAVIGQFQFDAVIPVSDRRAMFGLSVWSLGVPQVLVMSFVLWYYATDCLNAERRDRSILFWKSMPVSDTATVLSKLLTAMVIAPAIVWVVALATSLAAGAIWAVRSWEHAGGQYWDTPTWLHMQLAGLVGLAAASLWYAPLTAYLMLVSVWARRNVSLWVLLPPLVAALLERIAFGSTHIWTVIWYRVVGVWSQMSLGGVLGSTAREHRPAPSSPTEFLDYLAPWAAFRNIDLWIGVAIAAVLIYAVIRVRRYRDDT